MKKIKTLLTIGLMTANLGAFATLPHEQTPEDQTQQDQEERQNQQQQNQEQQQEQQQQQEQNCGVIGSAYLDIFVPDPCAHIYLQGKLMKTVRSHNRTFIIPGLETCKKYKYNVIITYGNHAESFDLLLEANHVQRLGVR